MQSHSEKNHNLKSSKCSRIEDIINEGNGERRRKSSYRNGPNIITFSIKSSDPTKCFLWWMRLSLHFSIIFCRQRLWSAFPSQKKTPSLAAWARTEQVLSLSLWYLYLCVLPWIVDYPCPIRPVCPVYPCFRCQENSFVYPLLTVWFCLYTRMTRSSSETISQYGIWHWHMDSRSSMICEARPNRSSNIRRLFCTMLAVSIWISIRYFHALILNLKFSNLNFYSI